MTDAILRHCDRHIQLCWLQAEISLTDLHIKNKDDGFWGSEIIGFHVVASWSVSYDMLMRDNVCIGNGTRATTVQEVS